MGEEGEVLAADLSEAEAGIEDDAVAFDAGVLGDGELAGEVGEDEGKDFVGGEWRQGGPVVGAAAGVHEDEAAGEVGAGGGHEGIPEEAADVVDDLGSGGDGGAGG